MDLSSWITIIMILLFLIYIVLLGWYIYRKANKDLDEYRAAIEDASALASAPIPPNPGAPGLPGLNAYELYLIQTINNEPVPPPFDNLATFNTTYTGTTLVADYRIYLENILTTNSIPFLNEVDFLASFNAADGDPGDDALPAVNGSQGENGSDGPIGPAGIDGAVGPSGIKGLTGEIGDTFVTFGPNNEIIEESARPGVLDNAAIFAPQFFPGNAASATSPEFYPSCEFVKYQNEISVDDRNPAANNTQADIRYYFKGNLMFDLTASWQNDPNGPTMYASYLIYTSDPFQIVGITAPITLNQFLVDPGQPLQTQVSNSFTEDLKFRVILSKNRGLTESVFTFNVVEENLQTKTFLLEREVPTDPFIRELYNIVGLTTGLNDNFNIEQKCRISEIGEVPATATLTALPNIIIS